MGGLHSGRRREHTNIDDCFVLDLARMRKEKLLTPGRIVSLQSKKWRETNFIQRKEYSYVIQAHITTDHITLYYQLCNPDSGQEHNHKHEIMLTRTPCNYGGERLWFLAPCCGTRVRVLYINPRGNLASITPQCRNCLELHYASQMASYVERHKTYERHLLANYGLTWAEERYNFELREHYQELTPELATIKLQSQYREHVKTLTLLIRCNRSIMREHRRALDSLKNREDQEMYTNHLLQEWGPGHVAELITRLHKPERRELVTRLQETWINKGEQSKAPLDLAAMIATKKRLEAALQTLEAA